MAHYVDLYEEALCSLEGANRRAGKLEQEIDLLRRFIRERYADEFAEWLLWEEHRSKSESVT